MSSVPKSEDLTQPQEDGQRSAIRKSPNGRRHHDNTDNSSIGSTEGDLSVNSGNFLKVDYIILYIVKRILFAIPIARRLVYS